jgi:hypothetical protein
MKKFYLSIAFLLPAMEANSLLASAPPAAAPTPPAVVPPTNSNVPPTPSLLKIFLVPPAIAQKALDDATAFVGMSPAKKVFCFSQQNGMWQNGFMITPIMQPGLPSSVCQTITTMGTPGPQITDFSAINIPIATQPFNWKPGSESNPDEWYTPGEGPASPTLQGICTSTETGDIGIAVRGQGTVHKCTFIGLSVPLADPTILVLAK